MIEEDTRDGKKDCRIKLSKPCREKERRTNQSSKATQIFASQRIIFHRPKKLSMSNQNSSLKKFLILGDSHVKHLGRALTTFSTRLVIKAFPGLKWVDNYDGNLSLYHMPVLSDIDYDLSHFHGVLSFVGTNSVRIMPAHKFITQIKEIIDYIRKNYPRFNQTGKITIPYPFPCLKTTNRFCT